VLGCCSPAGKGGKGGKCAEITYSLASPYMCMEGGGDISATVHIGGQHGETH
jgi:hypothetical protein